MFKLASINSPYSRNMNSKAYVSILQLKTHLLVKPNGLMSVTHTSAASYADAELKAVGHQINSSNILPLSNYHIISKFNLAPLCSSEKPTFSAIIVSDFGDLSPAALELQEWLVTAYAKKCE